MCGHDQGLLRGEVRRGWRRTGHRMAERGEAAKQVGGISPPNSRVSAAHLTREKVGAIQGELRALAAQVGGIRGGALEHSRLEVGERQRRRPPRAIVGHREVGILMPPALRGVALDLTPADEARDRALRRVGARLVRVRVKIRVGWG